MSAQGVGGEELLAAGGLALAANGHVLIEEQDVTISADRIRVVNVVRNTGERDVSLLVTFALPDLETLWIWDAPPLLPRSGDVNFVDAATTADGERVTPRLEQRAIALGLDVTDVLKALGLPSFPYATGLPEKIRVLPAVSKDDLVARGVLKAHGDRLSPAWTLRSTSYWRQAFPVGKAVTLALTYRPVTGRPNGSLAAFEKSACLDATVARRLEVAAANGRGEKITAVGFQATAGAQWASPIARFRLNIDKFNDRTVIATCQPGLNAVSPTRLEASTNNHAHEDDVIVLFMEQPAR